MLDKIIKDCLVPFRAFPCNSRVVWKAPAESASDDDLVRQACLVSSTSNQKNTEIKSQVLFAERYGGSGITTHGGGARCGYNGKYQIKGIGLTPVAGVDASKGHADGALSLTDALIEVHWSELLKHIMPWGIVSPIAALNTDYVQTLLRGPHEIKMSRALLLRNPVVRPAHFCRAPFYRPSSDAIRSLSHDAIRVQRTVQHLPSLLPSPQGITDSEKGELSKEDQVILGLSELAKRLGDQMAACRVNYLVPMTSPSNCAIDGRLLDFNGVMSAFPLDTNDAAGRYLQIQKLQEEMHLHAAGLEELCLNLGKHVFDYEFTCKAMPVVKQHYIDSLSVNTCLGFLEFAGLKRDFTVKHIQSTETLMLADFIRRGIEMEPGFVFEDANNAQQAHPLRSLLRGFLCAAIEEHRAAPLLSIGDFSRFRKVLEIYKFLLLEQLAEEVKHDKCVDRSISDTFDQIDRKLSRRPFLQRQHLYKKITNATKDFEGDNKSIRSWFVEFVKNQDIKFKLIFLGHNR